MRQGGEIGFRREPQFLQVGEDGPGVAAVRRGHIRVHGNRFFSIQIVIVVEGDDFDDVGQVLAAPLLTETGFRQENLLPGRAQGAVQDGGRQQAGRGRLHAGLIQLPFLTETLQQCGIDGIARRNHFAEVFPLRQGREAVQVVLQDDPDILFGETGELFHVALVRFPLFRFPPGKHDIHQRNHRLLVEFATADRRVLHTGGQVADGQACPFQEDDEALQAEQGRRTVVEQDVLAGDVRIAESFGVRIGKDDAQRPEHLDRVGIAKVGRVHEMQERNEVQVPAFRRFHFPGRSAARGENGCFLGRHLEILPGHLEPGPPIERHQFVPLDAECPHKFPDLRFRQVEIGMAGRLAGRGKGPVHGFLRMFRDEQRFFPFAFRLPVLPAARSVHGHLQRLADQVDLGHQRLRVLLVEQDERDFGARCGQDAVCGRAILGRSVLQEAEQVGQIGGGAEQGQAVIVIIGVKRAEKPPQVCRIGGDGIAAPAGGVEKVVVQGQGLQVDVLDGGPGFLSDGKILLPGVIGLDGAGDALSQKFLGDLRRWGDLIQPLKGAHPPLAVLILLRLLLADELVIVGLGHVRKVETPGIGPDDHGVGQRGYRSRNGLGDEAVGLRTGGDVVGQRFLPGLDIVQVQLEGVDEPMFEIGASDSGKDIGRPGDAFRRIITVGLHRHPSEVVVGHIRFDSLGRGNVEVQEFQDGETPFQVLPLAGRQHGRDGGEECRTQILGSHVAFRNAQVLVRNHGGNGQDIPERYARLQFHMIKDILLPECCKLFGHPDRIQPLIDDVVCNRLGNGFRERLQLGKDHLVQEGPGTCQRRLHLAFRGRRIAKLRVLQ